ncbi:mannose-6-phosphate isomerase, class I [Kitasatospora sp. NPDC096140]|uniref:mannose-6-phosphate isomerase, class I n=1 Tax=Kitasatospora sp. NPDC096140 TaxID=3155425 RepID=UPI00332B285F
MDLLTTTIQPYTWGSTTALAELMGVAPTGEPQAEMWLGAHPAAPSYVDRGQGPVALDRLTAAGPLAELGPALVSRFGPRLPFLLKLLAVDSPLSVQVHPDRAQAAAGFARENAEGIPLDAPHRTYRDDQHKPEMIVALTRFRALCGLRAPEQCADLLDALGVDRLKPYAEELRARPGEAALRKVFTAFLTPPDGLLAAVAEAVRLAAASGGRYAADLVAYAAVTRSHPDDPGLMSALMLNQVTLQPGQALFIGAGVAHAYLSGLGVEVMASSDNVLRCGLTSKHVDAAELLKVVRFTAVPIRAVEARRDETTGEHMYPAPVDEFRLSRFDLARGDRPYPLTVDAPQIVLCTGGSATVASPERSIALGPGRAAYAPAGEALRLSGEGTVFRVTTGLARKLTTREQLPTRRGASAGRRITGIPPAWAG